MRCATPASARKTTADIAKASFARIGHFGTRKEGDINDSHRALSTQGVTARSWRKTESGTVRTPYSRRAGPRASIASWRRSSPRGRVEEPNGAVGDLSGLGLSPFAAQADAR